MPPTDPETEAGIKSTLRTDLVAAIVQVEETEYATGFNAGIREAIAIIEAHDARRGELAAGTLRKMRSANRKTGGDEPYGYRCREDGTLRKIPAEQRVIAQACTLFKEGHTCYRIAQILTERGLRPRDTKRRFHQTQIRRMIDGAQVRKGRHAQP